MSKRPYFSIIIPTYNRASDLQFALGCLRMQDFTDFEIIVSDNDSTDNTNEVVKKLKDIRIKYFKNNKNIGVILNLKKAMSHAKGKYVFLHGDDDFIIDPKALTRLQKLLEKKNYGFVRLNYLNILQDSKIIFHFGVSKQFKNNEELAPHQESKKVVSFIQKVDPYFITGIVFKNISKEKVTILESELVSWFMYIFSAAKQFGAYYEQSPYIIASWSVWRMNAMSDHPLYGIKNERLRSENYYKELAQVLKGKDYKNALHSELLNTYVKFFPAVKYFTNNVNLRKLAQRLLRLYPDFRLSYQFWFYLFTSLLLPKFILGKVRQNMLARMVNNLENKKYKNLEKKVKELKMQYE